MLQILYRPHQVLKMLPLDYRWEFTRRHPYYLAFWNMAQKFRDGRCEDGYERNMGQAAHYVLLCIGASGEVHPPSATAADVGVTALETAWRNGAVAPVTVRNSIVSLLLLLPEEHRKIIGDLLVKSAQDSGATKDAVLAQVVEMKEPGFDVIIPASFNVDFEMPQRAIVDAVRDLVNETKKARGISETRRRDDRLADYLAVWEAREGWTGGDYDITKEQSFKSISIARGEPMSTINNQYAAAFRFISGHEYSFENWVRLFLATKLMTALSARSLRRRSYRRAQDEEHQEVVVPAEPADVAPIAEPQSYAHVEPEARELIDDVMVLIAKGRSDEEIVDDLELQSDRALPLVAYLRSRHGS